MSDLRADPRDALLARDSRPIVPLPRTGISGVAIAILCAVLALALFFVLDGRRRALDPARAPRPTRTEQPLAAPPPLLVPAAPPPAPTPPPAPAPVVHAAPMPAPVERAPAPYMAAPLPEQLHPITTLPPPTAAAASKDPVLVVDFGQGDGPAANSKGGDAAGAAGDDQAVRATIIRNRSSLVPQGTLIAAVLETPVDSSRPGLVRALVSRDVRGFDGTRVLIPRGSRLIGEAKGDVGPGQKRVLVTWTRLVRPDGVAIRIGSPAADGLGGAGLSGRVNTHFFERFASAVLQSALTVGVNLASRPGDGSVIVGLPGQLGTTVQPLLPSNNIPPTIKVGPGAEIAVFVARDLDFGGVAPRP